MNREPGNLGRIAASTASLVVALLVFQPVIASAEDAPPEAEVPDAAEDTAEAAVDSADAASAGATAQDVVEGLVAAPGGIPAEPMDPASAVDTVQAAMTNVQNDSSGIDEAYVIQFGDTFDWVQLTSGEWIKGNIKRMRDDTMEFDSDDLGMLYIDFGDIALVHSPQANTYVFDDRVSATGSAVVTEHRTKTDVHKFCVDQTDLFGHRRRVVLPWVVRRGGIHRVVSAECHHQRSYDEPFRLACRHDRSPCLCES